MVHAVHAHQARLKRRFAVQAARIVCSPCWLSPAGSLPEQNPPAAHDSFLWLPGLPATPTRNAKCCSALRLTVPLNRAQLTFTSLGALTAASGTVPLAGGPNTADRIVEDVRALATYTRSFNGVVHDAQSFPPRYSEPYVPSGTRRIRTRGNTLGPRRVYRRRRATAAARSAAWHRFCRRAVRRSSSAPGASNIRLVRLCATASNLRTIGAVHVDRTDRRSSSTAWTLPRASGGGVM